MRAAFLKVLGQGRWFKIGIAAAVVLFLFLRLPSLVEPHWYGDEGIYAAVGEQMASGELLYVDTWDHKPPAIYVLYALTSGFQGLQLPVLKLINILAGLATLFLMLKVAQQLWQSQAKVSVVVSRVLSLAAVFVLAVIFGGTSVEANTVNAENFFIPMVLAAVWVYLRFGQARPVRAAAISGLLLGIAVLFKFHPLLDAAALGWFILLAALKFKSGKYLPTVSSILAATKRLVVYGLAIVLPFAMVTGYYMLIGQFQAFFGSVVSYNFGYSGEFNASGLGFLFLPDTFTVRIILTFAAVLLLSVLQLSGKVKLVWGFTILWLIVALFGAKLSGRPYAHYFMQVVIPLLLSVMMIMGMQFSSYKHSAIEFLTRLVNGALLSFLVVYAALAVFWQNYEVKWGYASSNYQSAGLAYLGWQATTGFPQWQSTSPALLRQQAISSQVSRDWQRVFNDEALGVYRLGEFLQLQFSPGEKVFIWANRGWSYALAGVDNASPYVVYYHIDDRNISSVVETMLATSVVVIDRSYTLRPELEAELSNNYQLGARDGTFEAYRHIAR
jgi:hypothetical protein